MPPTVAGPLLTHNEKNVCDYMHIVTHFWRDQYNFLYQWDLLAKAPIIKIWFPAPWRILMSFVIQVLGGNKSSTEQLNATQAMMVFSLMEGRKIDFGEIIFKDLITKLTTGKSRQKLMSYPRFISCVLQDLLGVEYVRPDVMDFAPDVFHKANYSRDPTEVT